MSAEKFKRKLAAILSTDVKGYSRLMGEDEEGTLRTLNAHKEEAIPVFQKIMRLNPFYPVSTSLHFGHALWGPGRFEEAVSAFKKAIPIAPDDIIAHFALAATYSMTGREKEARAEAAEVLRINPKFSLD
jgi:tetratricopeptide (TPR) repeat protein